MDEAIDRVMAADRHAGRPHQRDRPAKTQIKDALSSYLYAQTKRRPMVFPVVVEV